MAQGDVVRSSVKTYAWNTFTAIGAGTDLAELAIGTFGEPIRVLAVRWRTTFTAPAGIDDSNTCVVTIRNGVAGATIVAKTYNTSVTPPGANSVDDLGPVSNASVAAGTPITLELANGTTADMGDYPSFEIDYI